MIEDVLIWKFVAEHPHCTRANSNPAFSTVIVCTTRLLDAVQESRRKQSYKCDDALDEQFERVSAR